jgi:glycosyl-4,4'-diaponeurosporenoate acyltransferase
MFELGTGATIAVDSAVWASWSLAVSTAVRSRSPAFLARDTWLLRLRAFERDGRVYERVRIRRWKDRVPEFGGFSGGQSKRTLRGRDVAALRSFAAETRKAEYVHWGIPAIVPLFAIWNPPVLMAAMVTYAVVANVPFIAIQRYNRGRVTRVLRSMQQRATTTPEPG